MATGHRVSWRWLKVALGRQFLLLVLLALVAALRSVDRNLALAVERGAALDLDRSPAIAVLLATAATVPVLVALHLPTLPGRSRSDRYTAVWRLARRVGLVAAVARLATTAWTLRGPDTPSRFASLSGAVVLAATVILIALYTLEGLSRGTGIADRGGHETFRAARLVRLSLGVSWVFAGLSLAAPYAADQIGDLLLAWTDAGLPPAASFGVAGILLLGLVLQEGAVTLVGAPDASGGSGVRARARTPSSVRVASASVALGSIAVFVLPGEFDLGTAVLAIPLGLLAASEWAERRLPLHAPSVPTSGATFDGIAVLPLFALAGGLVNATVDALFLYGPDAGYLARAIPPALALIAAVGALIVSTASLRRATIVEQEWQPWVAAVATLAGVAIIWLLGSARLAGLFALIALLTYTMILRGRGRLWALTLGRVTGAGLVAADLIEPVATGRGVGTIGAIGVILATAFSITQHVVRLFAQVELPLRVQRHVPLRQVPVLTMLAVWLAIATVAAPETVHDVRLTAPAPATPNGVAIDVAVRAWWQAQPEAKGTPTSNGAVPLVLVGAEGGGLRASYWTGGVLDVLASTSTDQRRAVAVPASAPACTASDASGRTFLISAVSGGSVGAYAYARQLGDDGCLAPGWYARWFARDLLGPTVAWGLVHDLFATLYHQRPGPAGGCRFGSASICGVLRDRAAILEEALDPTPAASGSGLRSASARPGTVPQLAFNTSSDDVRERVVLSTLQLEPRAGVVASGLDRHCADHDLPLVGAAVLSARFPVITPAGRIACAHRSLVDGGYLENTGLATIAETMPEIVAAVTRQNVDNRRSGRPPIRIVIVEISNGPRGPRTPLRSAGYPIAEPSPRFAPLGLLALPAYPTEIGRDELGRSARAACTAGVGVALITVRPHLAVGWKASVGWRLSRAAREELEQALAATDTATSPTAAARLLEPSFSAGDQCPWLPPVAPTR